MTGTFVTGTFVNRTFALGTGVNSGTFFYGDESVEHGPTNIRWIAFSFAA